MASSRDTLDGGRCEARLPQDLLRDLRDELLLKTGSQWAQPISGSMSPLIRPHDHVLIERVHPDQVRFGDVIMFASAEERVIHRVVGKKRCLGELTFLEKGDLNPSIGLVPAHHVLGRVSLVWRGGCSLDLLSGRGRAVQIALAVCSMAPLVTKESVKQVLGRL